MHDIIACLTMTVEWRNYTKSASPCRVNGRGRGRGGVAIGLVRMLICSCICRCGKYGPVSTTVQLNITVTQVNLKGGEFTDQLGIKGIGLLDYR